MISNLLLVSQIIIIRSVFYLVILFLQSNHVIVGLIMLVYNNLILLCNVLMFVFIKYNFVLYFINLYCFITL